jgi:hypothetical protein
MLFFHLKHKFKERKKNPKKIFALPVMLDSAYD